MLATLSMITFLAQQAEPSAPPWWVGIAVGGTAWFAVAYLFISNKIHSHAELMAWKALYEDEKLARARSEEATREALKVAETTGALAEALKKATRGT